MKSIKELMNLSIKVIKAIKIIKVIKVIKVKLTTRFIFGVQFSKGFHHEKN